MNTFKFIISKSDNMQYLTIKANYPYMMYPISRDRYDILEDSIEKGIDKLKISLIQEIVNAKFEYE